MKYLIILMVLAGCSSVPRTKWSDPSLRVALMPDGIDSSSYAEIQTSLVRSGKFFVIERGSGFFAAMREQDLTRVNDSSDRFDPKEKFARLKKLYGVGGLITAHMQCTQKHSVFKGNYAYCYMFLNLINTSTGEVVAVGKGEDAAPEALWNSPQGGMSPSWDETVNDLNQNIPAAFEKERWTPEMIHFKEVAKEESQREDEKRKPQ